MENSIELIPNKRSHTAEKEEEEKTTTNEHIENMKFEEKKKHK